MDCHTDVGRRQNGEYVCLQESNEGFERIHEEQQEEPCDCRQTRNDVHLEDGGLQEDGGCQREYGENHMAMEKNSRNQMMGAIGAGTPEGHSDLK